MFRIPPFNTSDSLHQTEIKHSRFHTTDPEKSWLAPAAFSKCGAGPPSDLPSQPPVARLCFRILLMGIFEKEIKPLLSSSSFGTTMSGTIKILSPPTVKNGPGSPGVSVRGGGRTGANCSFFMHSIASCSINAFRW